MSKKLPWSWNDEINYVGEDEEGFQFTFQFASNGGYSCPRSMVPVILPVIEKLGVKSILRMKANLSPRDHENTVAGMHTDCWPGQANKSAVLYINDNNGYTLFESGEKVMSKANRLCVFDSQIPHSSVTCTDEKRRVVLNVCYSD